MMNPMLRLAQESLGERAFLGAAVVKSGQGGHKPVSNEARVIKLTQ